MTRISELETIRESILFEIYRLCVESGVDPETLDVDFYAFDEPRIGSQNTLSAHCHKLRVVEQKIREIL